MAGMILRLGAILSLLATATPAQIEVSGTLDVAYKHDVGKQPSELSSRINSSLKGKSPFSLVRARVFADAALSESITASTTTLYDEGLGHFDLEGAYVIFHEIGQHPLVNVLAGKMAAVFGSFASRSFATVNPLIGTPLIYHYFSAIDGRSIPGDTAEQLGRRDQTDYQTRGQPLVYDACWNTGVQLFGASERFSYGLAVTKGALSNPVAASNSGAQIVGRLGVQPTMGWRFGVSAAYGPYLSERAASDPDLPAGRSIEDYDQFVVGVDGEYSFWHCELFFELVRNRWEVPNLTVTGLSNTGGYVEGTIALQPGLHCSLRLGGIRHDEIDDGAGNNVSWDHDINRVETGLEYYITPDARLKSVLQLNYRDKAAPDEADHMVGFQLVTRL